MKTTEFFGWLALLTLLGAVIIVLEGYLITTFEELVEEFIESGFFLLVLVFLMKILNL